MRLVNTILSSLLAVSVLTLAPAFAQNGRAPAGSVIRNQATATVEGQIVLSNVVETRIEPICSVSVTPDGTADAPGQRLGITPGGEIVLPYRLVNSGNATFDLPVTWTISATSGFTPASSDVRIYRDANGNGLLDPGESETSNVLLAQGEGADLLLVVKAPTDASGSAFLSLASACGSTVDANNYAELSTSPGPNLQLEKNMLPASIRPGETSIVTLRVRNTGDQPATSVMVTDLLDTPDLRDLRFVAGSLRAPVGQVQYTADGTTWQNTEPTTVKGVRWSLSGVDVGATFAATFRMELAPDVLTGTRENVAVMGGADLPRDLVARALLTVAPVPKVALGPSGNPRALPGGELGPDDRQIYTTGVTGEPHCFAQTLENLGNVTDVYTVTPTVVTGTAGITMTTPNGVALSQPVVMLPGQTQDFRVCVTPTSASDVALRLTVTSREGAPSNATLDFLNVPAVTGDQPLGLVKTVTPTGTLTRTQTATYTLALSNDYPFALTKVMVRDRLDDHLDFVSASDGGTYDATTRTVSWAIPGLASGERRALSLVVRVSGTTPDDTAVPNRFYVSSAELPLPVPSNEVVAPVFTSLISVRKLASVTNVSVGDRFTYSVQVHNGSPTAQLTRLRVQDDLLTGLSYLPGTSSVDGTPVPDPAVEGRRLTWTLPSLPAGGDATVTFAVRVLPGIVEQIVNTVEVSALGVSGAVVASNQAKVAVKVVADVFAPRGDIVGVVFIDRDRDRQYDERTDTPVARARVLLSNGRSVVTDEQGRYHLANVANGTWALRLVPGSVPYEALGVTQDRGLDGSRGVTVNGLTAVDFPLAPLVGRIVALRDTRVTAGPMRLVKTVVLLDGVYTVTLSLTTTAPLTGFELDDPLPAGATLLDGDRAARYDLLPAGTTTLTYRFRLGSDPETATTDPTFRWSIERGSP